MAKKMLIDATHTEETRVVVIDGTKVEEFDFETLSKRQISGNIYLAKVTRVEPSLQAAFVDYGGNRHGFLAFAEIHPDYYQIPAADRAALIAEEQAQADRQDDEDNNRAKSSRGSRASAARRDDETIAELAQSGDDDSDPGAGPDAAPSDEANGEATENGSTADDGIESVGEVDVNEEFRPARKSRPRRYKIQEVVRVRQIMLVQVVKEERGNKGAALTTYLSLAGRYCVLMPNTARGGGISRKITNAADRKKLKDIAGELNVPQGAGLIVRTAGSQRTRSEIRRDYEYLLRLWERIREVTFTSIAPAAIYEEGDLIKRSIRDLYSKEIDEVLVEGERGYRVAKDFMKMIMPSHAKNVRHYADSMPLFARYQVESYLAAMFNPVVQLKSGGYIVIGVTEALVAIDVNSGRATKEGSIEETALKTNLEASDEVARQLRLRDLAGLIVIDFIDMDERKNNAAVEKRLKDRLKSDRARIQVGKISGFGLMEMSRQRLRPGMLESTTQPCPHCHGTGLIRSDDSLALTILRAIEEEGTRKRSREVLVRAPIAVINFLFNFKREHIAGIEQRYGLSVRLEADPTLISPDFVLDKLKTTTRSVPEVAQVALSVNSDLMASIDEDSQSEDILEATAEPEAAETNDSEDNGADSDSGNRRRRRRRRRKKGGESQESDLTVQESGEVRGMSAAQDSDRENGSSDVTEAASTPPDTENDSQVQADPAAAETEKKPARKRVRGKKAAAEKPAPSDLPEVVDLRDSTEAEVRAADFPQDAPKPKTKRRSRKAATTPEELATIAPVVEAPGAETVPEPASDDAPPAQPAAEPSPRVGALTESAPQTTGSDDLASETNVEPAPTAPVAAGVADEVEPTPQPKRRGWWSSSNGK